MGFKMNIMIFKMINMNHKIICIVYLDLFHVIKFKAMTCGYDRIFSIAIFVSNCKLFKYVLLNKYKLYVAYICFKINKYSYIHNLMTKQILSH